MGNSVNLYVTHYRTGRQAWDDAGDEGLLPLRDRPGDIPAMLWLACFDESEMAVEYIDDSPSGYFFTSREAALERLQARCARILELFAENEGIDRCWQYFAAHLQSNTTPNLFLPIRWCDWSFPGMDESLAWTRSTLRAFDGAAAMTAEELARVFDFRRRRRKLFRWNWTKFLTPADLFARDASKEDWSGTGAMIGWSDAEDEKVAAALAQAEQPDA